MVKMVCVGVTFNWRNEVNQSGLYSVHVRIKQGNDSRYIKVPLPQKVREEQWSGKEGAWIKNSHPFAFEINNTIIAIKGKIANYIRECMNFNKPVTLMGIIG